LNCKVLKKKVVVLMRKNNPDIRDADVFKNADIIVALFFIPTHMDIMCRRITESSVAEERRKEYDTKFGFGSFLSYLWGGRQSRSSQSLYR